ncbi:MAG: carboxypeptidase regulatory-like domain-containing protein [Terriglobia bacterium]
MRWAKAILALAVLASSAAGAGQESVAPTPLTKPNLNEPCTLEGAVVKSTTGEGLKKIAVNLMSLQGEHNFFTSITDGNGRFTFNGVAPGRYALAAGGNGYSQQDFGSRRGRSVGKILTLTPGCDGKDLVFRLTPPGVITGTIRDEDGDPVTGGQVQALRLVRVGGRQQASPGGFAQTNDLGQYRIYGLEPGQYLIGASYQCQEAGNVPSPDVYLPTYYPSTSDTGQAMPIQVSPGDEVSGIDVDLTYAHSVTVRGRVVSEIPVKALRGSYVSLLPRDSFQGGVVGGNYGASVQDDLGNFEIRGVPPGSYVAFANLSDGARNYSGHALVDTASSNVEGVTVAVGPGLTLRGRVHLSPGAGLDLNHLGVSLQPAENYMGGSGAQVSPDGTFALENVTDGTYRLNVGGFPEEFYVQSARVGGVDILGPGLIVSHNDLPGRLDIMLSADGGRVDGVVLNNQQPDGDAIVVLIPDPPNRSRNELYSFKKTDVLGRFSLLGLPPGDFKLFAWEQRDGLPYTDPDFIKDYEDRGTRVHIEDKAQQSVQLQVIPEDEP